jgi:transcriptional regulator with XRE-family HTH domain
MSGSDRCLQLGNNRSAPIDELVGTALRQRREECELSISDLARAASLDEDDILRWETGETRIPANALLLLIEALKLDPPWFFESLHDLEMRQAILKRN